MFSPARLSIRSAIAVFPICVLCALALACSAREPVPAAQRGPVERAPWRLRVLTYNIHHGEGVDGRFDLERIAGVISKRRPDLVALQEVDVKTRRSGGVDQAAELARLTGMNVSFGKAIDYQGGEYGQAVLSRFPIHQFRTHRLPGEPQTEQRIAVEAVVYAWPSGPAVRFIGTHLHHLPDESNRVRQAEEINRLFASDGDEMPAILCGDFNAEWSSETMRRLLARWKDSEGMPHGPSPTEIIGEALKPKPTWPAPEPRKRIDYVLVRPTIKSWHAEGVLVVPERVASDHLPVVAALKWIGR
jgi:endonuclease/exonuclease/phosphatase family metal-dependent hydrolase